MLPWGKGWVRHALTNPPINEFKGVLATTRNSCLRGERPSMATNYIRCPKAVTTHLNLERLGQGSTSQMTEKNWHSYPNQCTLSTPCGSVFFLIIHRMTAEHSNSRVSHQYFEARSRIITCGNAMSLCRWKQGDCNRSFESSIAHRMDTLHAPNVGKRLNDKRPYGTMGCFKWWC